MRIWDIPVEQLCRQHLLGEHRELHALWTILISGRTKGGYANHPETKRWRGKTLALYMRHAQQVQEMEQRGYNHKSPLDVLACPDSCMYQTEQWQSTEEQVMRLRAKCKECKVWA